MRTVAREKIFRRELLAANFGLTTDDFVARLAQLGLKTSRSAAARYRMRIAPRRGGPVSPLAAQVIAKVLTLPHDQPQRWDRAVAVE